MRRTQPDPDHEPRPYEPPAAEELETPNGTAETVPTIFSD
jgi:hypothetical protein